MNNRKVAVIQINIKPKAQSLAKTTSYSAEGEKLQFRDSGKTFYRKDDLYAKAIQAGKEYAEKIGATHVEITEQIPELEGFSPTWARFKMYEMFEKEGYDNIIYIDGDCIVAPDAPNLMDFASDGFWAPENGKSDSYHNYITAPKKMGIQKRSNIPFTHRQFSCGMFVCDRGFYEATKDHWLPLCKEIGTWKFSEHDQEVMNTLVYRYYSHKYKLLSQDWGGPFKIGRWGLHYTCTLTADWTEDIYNKDMEKFKKRKPADKHPVNEVFVPAFTPMIIEAAESGVLNKDWFFVKENNQRAKETRLANPIYFEDRPPLVNMPAGSYTLKV